MSIPVECNWGEKMQKGAGCIEYSFAEYEYFKHG